MNDERLRCAEAALRQVPPDYRTINATDVATQERGHSYHKGMHIGWAWGEEEHGRQRPYLDLLSEHRHPGMYAERYYIDGTTEPIRTPASMRAVSPDPVEDAELQRRFVEENRAAYADLRRRGLLPPAGENLVSQDINEYLLSGGDDEAGHEPADPTQTETLDLSRSFPAGWHQSLDGERREPYWEQLQAFLQDEYLQSTVYPPKEQIFKALHLTPVTDVRVVILGQDPYPGAGQAHGLSFSVPVGVTRPRSLINIHRELKSDLGIEPPGHGSLESWARQGVLLLNTTLTVRRGEPGSHVGQGWETFTDRVITAVNQQPTRVVFILWGTAARAKKSLIDTERHRVIESAHPTSRANAHHAFIGSRPFSEANKLLEDAGIEPIDWATIAEPPELVV